MPLYCVFRTHKCNWFLLSKNHLADIQYFHLLHNNHYRCMRWWTPLHKDKHCLILQHGTILLVLDNDLKRRFLKRDKDNKTQPQKNSFPTHTGSILSFGKDETTARCEWNAPLHHNVRDWCYFTGGCLFIKPNNPLDLLHCRLSQSGISAHSVVSLGCASIVPSTISSKSQHNCRHNHFAVEFLLKY